MTSYCNAGPGSVIRTVCKYSMLLLYIKDIINILVRFFFGDCLSSTARKLYDQAKKSQGAD